MLKKYFSGLSTTTFLLAFASLFADVSTEMLYPVLPVFLTRTLGASPALVAWSKGSPSRFRVLSRGSLGGSRRKLRRRKPIAVAGYFLAAVSKPLIGLATSWTGVLGARGVGRWERRVGPADALVAASADEGTAERRSAWRGSATTSAPAWGRCSPSLSCRY